jgi:CDP-2,3-bis-(O-geranylgeranyl)-sn-glycerol synthase
MVFTLWNLIESIWIILPAFAANGFAPLSRGKRPIDMNKKFFDGRPIFGKGKTWEGLVLSVFAATIVGVIQQYAYPFLPFDQSPIILDIVPMSGFMGFLLGIGAMLGDLGGSFLKRRLRLPRGSPAPILDQDDFVIGALGIATLVVAVKLQWFLLLIVITPMIHLIANYIAFKIRVKNTKW